MPAEPLAALPPAELSAAAGGRVPHPHPLLLSKADIAARCSISVRELERLIAAGRFPPADVPLGRRCLRWRVATVTAAIDRLAGDQ